MKSHLGAAAEQNKHSTADHRLHDHCLDIIKVIHDANNKKETYILYMILLLLVLECWSFTIHSKSFETLGCWERCTSPNSIGRSLLPVFRMIIFSNSPYLSPQPNHLILLRNSTPSMSECQVRQLVSGAHEWTIQL